MLLKDRSSVGVRPEYAALHSTWMIWPTLPTPQWRALAALILSGPTPRFSIRRSMSPLFAVFSQLPLSRLKAICGARRLFGKRESVSQSTLAVSRSKIRGMQRIT